MGRGFASYSAFQIDELHPHNQSLVGTLHKGVPTVVCRHENCYNLLKAKLERKTGTQIQDNQDLRSTAIYGAKIIIFKILPLYIVPLRKS